MTVTKDEFAIGNSSWINSYNFAVMNDMHIGDGFTDFGSNGWDDDTIAGQTNEYIQNNENIVSAINNLTPAPDFVIVLGDITNSVERSELKKAKRVLSGLEVPYIPIMGNHDTRPYTNDDGESGIPDETYFGKYFYEAFAGIYDTNSLQFANWSEGPYFSTVSPPDYNTYYLNSSFNYQNYQFINVDYNTRRHAQWPFGEYGTQPDADVGPPPDHLLQWISQNVAKCNNEKRKLLCLGHQPLIPPEIWQYCYCYSPHEIHKVSDAGLWNNQPPAYWVGGHVHDGPSWPRIDTTYYGSDTVAIVFTLNSACKYGTYGYVRVYDKAKATIVHTPPSLPLPVTIKFMADYEFIDNAYAPYNYHWDFGDGYTYTTFYDYCYHTYHVANLYTDYKVTLTVRNLVWEYPNPPTFRLISIAKRIKVMASPYAVDTAFVHEDEVKLVWQFDVPGLIDGYKVRRGNT
jgi:hypothetical protein